MNIWPKQPVLIKNLKKKDADIKHKILFDKRKKLN